MASNSDSGFNFPAPKPRSSSERARQDALARGKAQEREGQGNNLFGSISDLGDAGTLEGLDPAFSRQVPTADPPLSELELDGIPDAFFEVAERGVSETDDPFELPSFLDDSQPAFFGNGYPDESSTGAGAADQLEDVPSGFFEAATATEPPTDDEEDSRFDIDFDVPSVLGEQSETAPIPSPACPLSETEPARVVPEADNPTQVAIPSAASRLVRPSADPSFRGTDRPVVSSASPIGTRTPTSQPVPEHPRMLPPLIPEVEAGAMLLPRIPRRVHHAAGAVSRSLEASPATRRTTPSGPHREVGRSPRPADAPLAAIRRRTSGSHAAVPVEDGLVPFEDASVESLTANADRSSVGPPASLPISPVGGDVPAFDEFDYASDSGRVNVIPTTHVGRQVLKEPNVE